MEGADLYRALSITSVADERDAPMLYELTGDSTTIGSAEGAAILLADARVAPLHLAIHRADGRDHLLVDLGACRHERGWSEYRAGDAYRCPRHGALERLDRRGWCPQCRTRRGSLWLIRPLAPGDVFEIGGAFRATYIASARAPRRITLPASARQIPTRTQPTDDSNLWRWQPAGVPFPIFLHQRVNRAITQHARQNTRREVGGILLGEVCQDGAGQMFVVATHALQAEFAEETQGHLTFTQRTWLKMHTTREAQYPDKVIVGWYHTHPGWTIFLSEWDLFIHRSFFKDPWQFALVIDPSLDRAGFFVWKDNQVADPHMPVEPFRLAELDGWAGSVGSRIHIKLTAPANRR